MSSTDQLSDPTASTPYILAEMLTQGHSSGDAAAMARLLHKLAEVFTLAQKYPLADREPHQPSHRHKLDSRLAEYATDGFYPVSTDGLIKAENSRSRRATLRRMRGLWNRSR